jgi:phage-related protein
MPKLNEVELAALDLLIAKKKMEPMFIADIFHDVANVADNAAHAVGNVANQGVDAVNQGINVATQNVADVGFNALNHVAEADQVIGDHLQDAGENVAGHVQNAATNVADGVQNVVNAAHGIVAQTEGGLQAPGSLGGGLTADDAQRMKKGISLDELIALRERLAGRKY